METTLRRHALVAAACKVAALEYEGITATVVSEQLHRARTVLDLECRLYVEAIGPRVVEPSERQYGQTTHGTDTEEEE
jgi:hypothetical protein